MWRPVASLPWQLVNVIVNYTKKVGERLDLAKVVERPVYRELRSNCWKSGRLSISMNMVGVP